jgi:hypothetical protein
VETCLLTITKLCQISSLPDHLRQGVLNWICILRQGPGPTIPLRNRPAPPQATHTLPQAMTARVVITLSAVMVRSRCRGSGGGMAMRGRWGMGGNPRQEI